MVYLLLFIKIQFSEPSCWVITPARYNLVPTIGIEPKVYRLSADCSTIELHGYNFGTEDWTRTNHTQIFSLLLYQLSYSGINTVVYPANELLRDYHSQFAKGRCSLFEYYSHPSPNNEAAQCRVQL